MKIRNDYCTQYGNYKNICPKVYQRSCGIFCDILKDLTKLSTGKGIEVLEGDEYRKYFFGEIKCDF